MKCVEKLRARWDKTEDDFMTFHPEGWRTSKDSAYLLGVLSRDVRQELTRRGYDVRTLRFEICPIAGHSRFASPDDGDEAAGALIGTSKGCSCGEYAGKHPQFCAWASGHDYDRCPCACHSRIPEAAA